MSGTMTAPQYQARMTEAQWRRLVRDTALTLRWRVLFELPDKAYVLLADEVRRNPRQGQLLPPDGWVDLVIGRDNDDGTSEIHFLELKTDKGRPSAAQLENQTLMARANLNCGIWRPRDWPELVEVLR